MTQQEQTVKFSCLPMGFVLFVVFLVLKLTGVIDWSWWYVTMPLWIWTVLVIAATILAVVLVNLFRFLDWLWGKARPQHAAKRKQQKNVKALRKALDQYSNALTRR